MLQGGGLPSEGSQPRRGLWPLEQGLYHQGLSEHICRSQGLPQLPAEAWAAEGSPLRQGPPTPSSGLALVLIVLTDGR